MSGLLNSNEAKILLVEGKNDLHVITALCQYYKIPKNFCIAPCDSDDLVVKKLRALLDKRESYKTIGIVLDADRPNLAGKWDKFKDTLMKAGVHCINDKPDENGTIISAIDEYPKIGLWLMPDNRIDGMLEDFCLTMASATAIDYVQGCISTAQIQGHTSFISNHHSKAVVHTFLAWQDEPGRPLGQAITANVLNAQHILAKIFANWLQMLFAD